MLTIKDIAKLAGVSQATVSKALNNRPDIGLVTKSKILEIVKELQFSPDAFAKSLKNRYSENIGVVFSRFASPLSGNPFFSKVLEGIEAEIAINNFNLILQIMYNKSSDQMPKMVRERQVEGLILVGIFDNPLLDTIIKKNIPTVFVDPKESMSNFNQILIDNEHGAFMATQYLINAGHRRIGFISGDLARMSFNQRYEGYQKAMRYNGIDVNENLVKTGGNEKGYDHVRKLMTHEKPTAIFAANDINAIYGYQAIHEMKMRIPDDISIIGFDDIELSKMSLPPLTTIRVYKEELGSIAVRILLRIIKRETNEQTTTTVVPVKLIERKSVRKIETSV